MIAESPYMDPLSRSLLDKDFGDYYLRFCHTTGFDSFTVAAWDVIHTLRKRIQELENPDAPPVEETIQETNTCQNCKHLFSWCGGNGRSGLQCRHPKFLNVDLITGDRHHPEPINVRHADRRCVLWELKHTFWDSLRWWFSRKS